jgi:hypothetical protein
MCIRLRTFIFLIGGLLLPLSLLIGFLVAGILQLSEASAFDSETSANYADRSALSVRARSHLKNSAPADVVFEPEESKAMDPSGDRQARASVADEELRIDRENVIVNRGQFLTNRLLWTVAVLQLLVYVYQSKKLRDTVKAGEEQSRALERHISEARRLADAAEVSAKAGTKASTILEHRTAAQMRAYIGVVVGAAIYQERVRPKGGPLKFSAKPLVVNSGHTPAYRVSHKSKSQILRCPLTGSFDFPIPSVSTDLPVLMPNQSISFQVVVDDFVDDTTVDLIKKNDGNALYVWGIVTYRDVFEVWHETRYCQYFSWQNDDSVLGTYVPGQNDAS